MTTIAIQLADSEAKSLTELAQRSNLTAEELVTARVRAMLEIPGTVTTLSAQDVLVRLREEGLGLEEKRRLIIEAEALTFDQNQVDQLKPLLRDYIQQRRYCDDPAELVSVASAIRKYVATIGQDELDPSVLSSMRNRENL